jgi:hypothetical protein
MKILFILILLASFSGCTVNYIHGTDVVVHQSEKELKPLD